MSKAGWRQAEGMRGESSKRVRDRSRWQTKDMAEPERRAEKGVTFGNAIRMAKTRWFRRGFEEPPAGYFRGMKSSCSTLPVTILDIVTGLTMH